MKIPRLFLFAWLTFWSLVTSSPQAAAQTAHELWSKRYNNPGNTIDGAIAVALDAAGNVVVNGYSFVNSQRIFYTAKYAAGNGALLWEKRYLGPGGIAQPLSMVLDADGNAIVTGGAAINSNGDDAFYYTVKYASADGSVLWEKTYTNPQVSNLDSAIALTVDESGNVFVTGESFNVAGNADYVTIKYAAADGAVLWTKRYDGISHRHDEPFAIIADPGGNAVVTGASSNGLDYSNNDFYTAKYAAASGVLLWEKRYNGPANGDDVGYGVASDASGNIIVTGKSWNGTNYDYYTAKYAAADGALLWEKRYNGLSNRDDIAWGVVLDAGGNVLVTGQSLNASNLDYYTAKYAATDGTLIWEQRYNSPSNRDDQAFAIAIDSSGNPVVTGQSVKIAQPGGFAGFDYVTFKYDSATGAPLWEKRYDGLGGADDRMDQWFPYTHLISVRSSFVAITGQSSGDFATVKYIDGPSPTLSPVTISSSNANQSYAKVGDTISLTFSVGEPAFTPIATIAGSSASVTNLGGNNWRATLTVNSNAPQGVAAFSIAAVNLAGTGAAIATATTNGSSVTIDRTAPIVTPVTITSNNPDPRYATVGNTVTLTFTATEPIQPPIVTFSGIPGTVTNTAGNTWQATLLVSGTTSQGPVNFSASCLDFSGNAAFIGTTTNGGRVTVDRTAPSLTLLGANPLTVQGATVYTEPGATATDTVAGNLTASIQITGAVNTNVVGNYVRSYTVADFAGNTATATRTVKVVDTIPPVLTVLGDNPATVGVGAGYFDVGATASDTLAGNLTAAIQTSSNVNANVIGTYTVSYTVSDGFNTASAIRTVKVIAMPAAGMDTLGTVEGIPVSAPAVKLLANDTDPDGRPLSVTGVSPTSARGGTVVLDNGLLTYTPPAGFTGSDSFTYTIANGFGGTATGMVSVVVSRADGSSLNVVSLTQTLDGFLVRFAGIPGNSYLIQATNSMAPPVVWTTLVPPGPIQAGPNGLFQYEDKPNPIPPQRFYRAAIPQ